MAAAPNILWIVTTQWRAQTTGFAGDPQARTPNLDRLAQQSTWYRQAVTPHPFGPFARAALLTGVRSPENGVRDYFDALPPSGPTVARALSEQGYMTAFFGKWHLGPRDPASPLVGDAHAKIIVPPDRRGGFALWEGFESGFLLNDPWLHGTRLSQPTRFSGYQADVLCERAADFLTGARLRGTPADDRPWFAMVSLETPHPPYDAPAAEVRAPDPSALQLPANVPRGGACEEKARRELAGYYAHIEATDRAIGRLLDKLEAADLSGTGRDTNIVFTSVHGDMHGAHGLFRKGWPHEESVRVPLLIRRGGTGVPAGKISDECVSLLDLPRIAAGWATDAEVPLASPGACKISMPSVVRLEYQCDREWSGVRTATRKLVLNADGSPWLLFNLEQDPLETNNLTGDPAWQDEMEALRSSV